MCARPMLRDRCQRWTALVVTLLVPGRVNELPYNASGSANGTLGFAANRCKRSSSVTAVQVAVALQVQILALGHAMHAPAPAQYAQRRSSHHDALCWQILHRDRRTGGGTGAPTVTVCPGFEAGRSGARRRCAACERSAVAPGALPHSQR